MLEVVKMNLNPTQLWLLGETGFLGGLIISIITRFEIDTTLLVIVFFGTLVLLLFLMIRFRALVHAVFGGGSVLAITLQFGLILGNELWKVVNTTAAAAGMVGFV
jgi:hypothetical protein